MSLLKPQDENISFSDCFWLHGTECLLLVRDLRKEIFYSDHNHIKLESTRNSMSSIDLHSIEGNSIFLTFCIFKSRLLFFCGVHQSVWEKKIPFGIHLNKIFNTIWEKNFFKKAFFSYCKTKFYNFFLSSLTVKVA